MSKLPLVLVGLLTLLSTAVPSPGQEPPAPASETRPILLPGHVSREAALKIAEALGAFVTLEPEDVPATLVLRNIPVVTLKARVAGSTPKERVAMAAKRFADAVGGRRQAVPEASLTTLEQGTLFAVGDNIVFGITDLDLDPMGGETMAEASRKTLENLSLVLNGLREERSLRFLLTALGVTAAATVALAAALWLLALLMRRLQLWVHRGEEAVKSVVGGDGLRSPETRKLSAMTKWAFTLSIWGGRIFFLFAWLAFSLKQFPYTRPWGEALGGFVVATVKGLTLGIVRQLPDLFTVILIFVVARLLARAMRTFFESVERGKIAAPWVFPETAMPTRKILVFLIWVFAIVAAYPYLPGSGSEAFKGLSVLLGLMISLGGSGVVSQAMGGLVLMYSRALQPGDYVRIGEVEGVVTVLGMMATKIRTAKREEITIPNSVVLGTSTRNFSRLAGRDGVIVHTAVTIGYSDPWRRVHQQLIEAAGRTAGLKKEPLPFVLQTALSDFYVEYQLNAYMERPEERPAVLAALHANIQDSFNEAGIAIVSPHYVADPPNPMPGPQ